MIEHPALVAAARHGLGQASRPPITIDREAADEVLAAALLDRLSGLLYQSIVSGAVHADDETIDSLRTLWQQTLVGAVLVEALAVRVAEVLDSANISWRLTKGAALAHLDYPDPTWRPFGDVDVIVHPADWLGALAALGASGYKREAEELAGGFDQRFGKGATLTSPDGLEVDMHRRLAIGRFGVRLPTEVFFDAHDTIDLAGRQIPVPTGSLRLVHACFHAALGGFRMLRAHRDVVQLLIGSDVDWEQAVAIAERHGVSAVVSRAIVEAWERLELNVDHPAHRWATRHRPGRLDRHALHVFGTEQSFARQALTAVPPLIGRGATAYLVALTLKRGRPDNEPIINRARRLRKR